MKENVLRVITTIPSANWRRWRMVKVIGPTTRHCVKLKNEVYKTIQEIKIMTYLPIFITVYLDSVYFLFNKYLIYQFEVSVIII